MRKCDKPKKRWATRFRKHMQKSKKKRKGPQTHLLEGKAKKTKNRKAVEAGKKVVMAENPLIDPPKPEPVEAAVLEATAED